MQEECQDQDQRKLDHQTHPVFIHGTT
jgi:hypothetical protein